MEYIYFGNEDKKLFGVYQPPLCAIDKNIGILLCNPLGQENTGCQKIYKKLSKEIADLGIHSLRFDYYGTGDSYGKTSELSIDSIHNDISNAISELREGCEVEYLYVLGIRFGAIASALLLNSFKVDGLILWAPVINGNQYIKQIKNNHKKWFGGTFNKNKKITKDYFENLGFQFSMKFINELNKISLKNMFIHDKLKVLLLDERRIESEEFIELCNDKNIDLDFYEYTNKEFWIKQEDEKSKSMLPVKDIELIKEWISQKIIRIID